MPLHKSIKQNQFDSPGLFTAEMLGETEIPADLPAPNRELPADNDTFFFISFGSGSSGNCAYVGDRDGGFLIDAGIDSMTVVNTLRNHGIPMTKVRGILLTHDHGDHVRYVYSFLRNNRHMHVFCTPKTMNGLLRRHSISRRIREYHRAIYKEFEFQIGNFTITPFDVSHDGTDNCGFFISHGSARMAVATDLGTITDRVRFYMSQVNVMVIESNYDLQMLREGTYPDHLKARIIADNGHLDNEVSARFVAQQWTPQLTHVFLCHLSHDNNRPEKAFNAHRRALLDAHPDLKIGDGLRENLTDLQLVVLPRFDATPLYGFRHPQVS